MEIKRLNNYSEILLDNQRFVLDGDLKETPPLILTDFSLKINRDKIFNSPGEYNVGNVYFRGFDEKDSISYLFQSDEGTLFYFKSITEETIKKIKSEKIEIEAIFFKEKIDKKIISELNPSVIFAYQDFDLPKFQKEKNKQFKVNLKKVKNLIYILE